MKILCILQNAWGDRILPVTFVPNPYNKSAKVIRKIVGCNYYEFSNTTDVVTNAANKGAKPNYKHFERVVKEMSKFDLILVCGVQAKETVIKFIQQISAQKKPLIFMPHPAARNLSNEKCHQISEIIRKYENICSHNANQ